jgi:hypothetical protein
MSEGMAKRVAADWRASGLRVTAFLAPEVSLESRDLWAALNLGEPESHEKKKGQVTDQGPALDQWLVITAAISRIDWLYVPKPDESEETEFGFRDVGPFPEAVDKFVALIGGWLQRECPKLVRFAFGATARLPVASRIEGYRQLSAYLPFRIDGEASSDFLYQINRHRKSTVDPELNINRLTQWSVAALTGLAGQVILGPSGISPVLQPYGSQSACQIIMDVNSDPEYLKGFQKTQVKALLDEFAQMAKEIAAEGDIP